MLHLQSRVGADLDQEEVQNLRYTFWKQGLSAFVCEILRPSFAFFLDLSADLAHSLMERM